MRVLLIQPNQGNHIGFRYVALTEPLGLETIAACLPHHDVRILDMRLEKGLIEHLRDFQPQAVGITVSFSTDVYNALEILRAIKEYDSKIYTFVGGHHASLNPPDFLRGCVDAVVIGEGEETTPELLDLWEKGGDINKVRGIAYLENGNLKFTPSRELIRDLNVTPIPSRELTKKHRSRYFYKASRPISSVETARGCPFRCKFCSVWQFYKRKYRARSPERVLREIESISTKNILFTDDNFLQSTSRANRIYELIKEVGLKKRYAFQARTDTIASHPEIIKKWKTIGLDWVLIGFESIWDEELQEFNKDNTMAANEKAVGILQENKVGIQAAFIVNPLYGRKEFQMLIKYVKKMKLYAGAQFTILTPLPGTEFFREKWDELTTRNYELFDFLHAVLPTNVPLQEFYKNFCSLYKGTLLSFRSVLKAIFSSPFLYTPSDLKRLKALRDLLSPKSYLKGHLESR